MWDYQLDVWFFATVYYKATAVYNNEPINFKPHQPLWGTFWKQMNLVMYSQPGYV